MRWSKGPACSRRIRSVLAVAAACVVVGTIAVAATASADGLSLSGGDGTTVYDDQLYAREGGTISPSVATSADTECVVTFVNGEPVASESSAEGTTAWTPTFLAGAGDGVRSVRATAYSDPACEHSTGSATASFVLDNTGPVVRARISPVPNDAGWNNTLPVTLIWSAVDDGFSGVEIVPSPRKVVIETETPGETLSTTATDRLGNVGQGETVIRIDGTPPTISGHRAPAANAYGWNNEPVTVTFDCDDALSGVASCSPATTIRAEGRTGAVHGDAIDAAGNSSRTTVGPINIDSTPPTIVITGVVDGAVYRPGSVPVPSCTARDALSGAGTCTGTVAPGDLPGVFTYTARASDKAGNQANRSVSYRVAANGGAYRVRATLRPSHRKTPASLRGLRAHGVLAGTVMFRSDGTIRLAWRLTLRGAARHRTQAEIRIGKGHRRVGLVLCRRCRLRTHGDAIISPALARRIISGSSAVEVRLRRHTLPLLVGMLRVHREAIPAE